MNEIARCEQVQCSFPSHKQVQCSSVVFRISFTLDSSKCPSKMNIPLLENAKTCLLLQSLTFLPRIWSNLCVARESLSDFYFPFVHSSGQLLAVFFHLGEQRE